MQHDSEKYVKYFCYEHYVTQYCFQAGNRPSGPDFGRIATGKVHKSALVVFRGGCLVSVGRWSSAVFAGLFLGAPGGGPFLFGSSLTTLKASMAKDQAGQDM